ncbi:MAG: prepilin peptidase [Candidatus Yanofskybacteria bacterium]|nr:prepilin peptidase [Candidatus Yanofskybacteria bacterium]
MVNAGFTYVLLPLPLMGFFLGLMVGSFVNVVIYRIPRGQGIFWGRSACPNCRKKLSWYDLIPVFSFFVLKARCRQCRQRISWLYPAVELYSGVIFVLALRFLGQVGVVDWLFAIFILEALFALALIDLKNFILPDSVMLVMLTGILAYGILEYFSVGRVFNVFSFNNFLGAIVLFSILFFVWFLSKGVWLGLGDAKFAGLIGLIFGFWGGLIIFYGAVAVGSVVGLILLIGRRANLKTKLPFGAFIGFSATVYFFFGRVILEKIKPIFFSVSFILR